MHVCERQAGTGSIHTQYSYNSSVIILLVSLLSRASGSLKTTPFHFYKHVFTLVIGASLSEPHSSEYYTEIPVLFACLLVALLKAFICDDRQYTCDDHCHYTCKHAHSASSTKIEAREQRLARLREQVRKRPAKAIAFEQKKRSWLGNVNRPEWELEL